MRTFEDENCITVTTQNSKLVSIITNTSVARINGWLNDPTVANLQMIRTGEGKWILTYKDVQPSEIPSIPPTYSVFCAAVMVDDSRVQTKLCGQVENVLAHDPHYNGPDHHDFIPSKTRVNEGVVPNYLSVRNLPKTVIHDQNPQHAYPLEFCGHILDEYEHEDRVSICGRAHKDPLHKRNTPFTRAHEYFPSKMIASHY